MTLQEAIEHCKEIGKNCDDCGIAHQQLAVWLENYRKMGEVATQNQYETGAIARGALQIIAGYYKQ